MKIQKITLLIAMTASLSMFAAQEFTQVTPQKVIDDINDMYDKVGNTIPARKRILDNVINKLNMTQIKDILDQLGFNKKVTFNRNQLTFINSLLRRIIILDLDEELEINDLKQFIKLAKTIQYDIVSTISQLKHTYLADSKEANKISEEVKPRKEINKSLSEEIIPKLENLLKNAMAKDRMQQENITLEEALKAVVLPDIKKTEESCVIA